MPRKPNACSFHEAVTRAESLFGWVQSAKACQAFVGQDGYSEQYMEWDDWANGVKDGNSHVITIETFDGLKISENPYRETGMGGIYGDSANTGRWDAGQCERLADIAAFLNIEVGISLVMSNRAGNPGFGPHRLGVEPWRSDIYGAGESWTAHNGKPCPGDLRIQQMPGIIARAQIIAEAIKSGDATYLPTGKVNLSTALARNKNATPATPEPPAEPADWLDTVNEQTLRKIIAEEVDKALDKQTVADDTIENPDTKVKQSLGTRIMNINRTAKTNQGILMEALKKVRERLAAVEEKVK